METPSVFRVPPLDKRKRIEELSMPNNDSKTYIVNDQPTERDALDFTPYVETLADIIQTGDTPLTIGVFGGWGSGKSRRWRASLRGNS